VEGFVKHWLIIGAALVALSPAAASAAGLGGVWTINGEFNGVVKYTVVCTLAETGDKLAGPCKDNFDQTFNATGSASGAEVLISYDTLYNGAPVHLDYKGDVQTDGSLKGSVDAGIAQGTFTAKR
jgi:hypothetical protein